METCSWIISCIVSSQVGKRVKPTDFYQPHLRRKQNNEEPPPEGMSMGEFDVYMRAQQAKLDDEKFWNSPDGQQLKALRLWLGYEEEESSAEG